MAQVEATETWLKSHGATFTFTNINLEQVDKVASHRNQARVSGPINDETVVLYAAAIEQGDQFPPLVVHQKKDGKFVVIDGNHRVAAYELNDIQTSEAYVVSDINETQRLVLTYESNAKHGLPTGLQERLRQAINMVEMGATMIDASKTLGLPFTRVQNSVAQFKTDKRLTQLGVSRWDRIPTTSRRRLSAIASNKVLEETAKLAVESQMTGTEIENLVVRINSKKGSESDQLAMVEQERETRKDDIKTSAGGRIGWSRPALGLNSILSRTVRLDVEAIRNDSIGSDQKKRLRARTVEAMDKLRKVAEVLA
jgi:ParB-like chromosome segregation protein Spo0J